MEAVGQTSIDISLFTSLIWAFTSILLVAMTEALIARRRSHPARLDTRNPHAITVFIYYVTRFDGRWQIGLGSMTLLLKHMNAFGFTVSLNIILFNQNLAEIQPLVEEDLRVLSFISRMVTVHIHAFYLSDLVSISGTDFPIDGPFSSGHWKDRWIAMGRLFIPLIFHADWFLYLDDDVEAVGHFFPEVFTFTSDSSKVMFAVQDQWFDQADFPQRYLRRVKPGFNVKDYFGSGFLLMRGGAALRRELTNVLYYFRDHRSLLLPDQDALNFGMNHSYVHLLPWKYCVLSNMHGQMGRHALLKHYNGPGKTVDRGIGLKLATAYRQAKEHYQAQIAREHVEQMN
jgi:hypothetical protein